MPRLLNSLHIVVVAFTAQSAALALTQNLLPRDIFDVNTYASLGESFASGPSAGNVYDGVTACRRYTEAFGPQVSRDNRIHGRKPMDFKFIACSGSRTKHIYEGMGGNSRRYDLVAHADKPKEPQSSFLKDVNPDLVTMSIGGNDVGFVDLLDRCVYRFKDVKGCAGCNLPRLFKDDCSGDCQEAIDGVRAKINGPEFSQGLTSAIKSVFANAPRTHLFVTGYPAFWNHDTDACDKVSFKFGCINNSVLPLIKSRRKAMNDLTDALNGKIRQIINSYPTSASLTFVDTNPFFNGHRFCEQGVSEPSYRNKNIWFYPFEYWTGSTLNVDAGNLPTGDCDKISNDGGDFGAVFGCYLGNALKTDGTTLDLHNQTNNVQGDGDVAITSSDGLPDFLARIFHPTKAGMGGYRDGIVSAYSAYHAQAATPTSTSIPKLQNSTPPSIPTSTPTSTLTSKPAR